MTAKVYYCVNNVTGDFGDVEKIIDLKSTTVNDAKNEIINMYNNSYEDTYRFESGGFEDVVDDEGNKFTSLYCDKVVNGTIVETTLYLIS